MVDTLGLIPVELEPATIYNKSYMLSLCQDLAYLYNNSATAF